MSKITFRADDDLVERLEEYDASKSEVMREALRRYLDREEGGGVDGAIAERVDDLIEDRLDGALGAYAPAAAPEVTVNVSLEGAETDSSDTTVTREGSRETDADARKTERENERDTPQTAGKTCPQCGENVPSEHVYCPNCGEKASHRVFCECGDELRSDWAFCPSCGRRTPAADVLDNA